MDAIMVELQIDQMRLKASALIRMKLNWRAKVDYPMANQGFDNSISRLILNWYRDNPFGVNISDDQDILIAIP